MCWKWSDKIKCQLLERLRQLSQTQWFSFPAPDQSWSLHGFLSQRKHQFLPAWQLHIWDLCTSSQSAGCVPESGTGSLMNLTLQKQCAAAEEEDQKL